MYSAILAVQNARSSDLIQLIW